MKAGDPRHPASKPRHYESKRGSTLTLGERRARGLPRAPRARGRVAQGVLSVMHPAQAPWEVSSPFDPESPA